MVGINSFEKKGKSSNFLREQAFITKTQQEIAESLGTKKSQVVAMKNHTRGASVQVAKKAAATTRQKPANIFLTSQVAALEKKITTKAIKDENVLGACQSIMRAIKGQFRDAEFDRRDAEFVAAAERLRDIAIAALEMAPADDGNGEPITAVGDSTAVATKGSTRDAWGRAIPEGPAIQRDAYGRALRS
jgi:transcriptional regulator